MHARTQGHFEVFICNTDELPDGADSVPTQECFNKYPLDRAADNDEFSPIDPNYPGRYFVDPECRKDEIELNRDLIADAGSRGYTSHMRYVLPEGLECKQCVIQSVYRECYWEPCSSVRYIYIYIDTSLNKFLSDQNNRFGHIGACSEKIYKFSIPPQYVDRPREPSHQENDINKDIVDIFSV